MNKPTGSNATATADLLIELGCEELPPKSLPKLAMAFFAGLKSQLVKAELGFNADTSRVYYTPRRLTLLVSELTERQPDQSLERRGPALSAAFDADNQPTPAAIGFARSIGKNVDDLETLKTDKGEWLYCLVEKPGQKLEDLLYPMLNKVLADLPIAKPMRWGTNDFSFIRPVHWLVVMHGSTVLNGELFGLSAGNTTHGHRVHSPGPHEIGSAKDYERLLESASVVVDQDKRREMIENQVIKLGAAAGGKALIDANLLEEVTCLVEWPRSIRGNFDEEFLDLPSEALIASMQDHQKFFPVIDNSTGKLLARFVTVANLDSADFDAVRKGFERVIKPRLADARFFWDQDNKSSLEDLLPQLDNIVFQKNLGSVGDKSQRIVEISQKLAEELGADTEAANRAASLCKCDLVSHMVGEFPELQGVMGRYYAANSGEAQPVSVAIGEHYLPAYSGDQLPASTIGKIVSMADRLDTLTGIFAIGLKPTGNKDPFALRRAALGLVRILLEGELDIELSKTLAITASAMQGQMAVSEQTLQDLRHFILERLKHYLRDKGYETTLVNAALDAPLGTLVDLHARLDALKGFMNSEVAASLAAANKRIGNILRKSDHVSGNKIDEDMLVIDEERQLFTEIRNITGELTNLYQRTDYASALTLLAGLSTSVDAFFDKVMVMDDDPGVRNNRLNLLAELKGMFDQVANLAMVG